MEMGWTLIEHKTTDGPRNSQSGNQEQASEEGVDKRECGETIYHTQAQQHGSE